MMHVQRYRCMCVCCCVDLHMHSSKWQPKDKDHQQICSKRKYLKIAHTCEMEKEIMKAQLFYHL